MILLRKKLYTQATKNLERAQKSWSGEPEELAQVHNALGFAFFNMEKVDPAISQYRKAVELQPGYVTGECKCWRGMPGCLAAWMANLPALWVQVCVSGKGAGPAKVLLR